jgi:tetratricopeptide (TPR) repeat protein
MRTGFAGIFSRSLRLCFRINNENLTASTSTERKLSMSSRPTDLPEVFISYAHEDRAYKDDLVKQLDILEQVGKISCWHDGELVAGDQWDAKIKEHLKSSSIILLLVSPDFTFSTYIRDVEMRKAIERHKAGEALVIPVLVRNTNAWEGLPFGELKLGSLQAVPTDDEYTFISEWPNRDAAFEKVAAGIERAIERLKVKAPTSSGLANLPPPPLVDFVARKGRDGRDLVGRLKEELSPPNKRLVALIGGGGMGKTTLAAEVVRALADIFEGRIVWASAEKRADFSFSTLLDEIAIQLGEKDLSRLGVEQKAEAVRGLVAAALTLIVLDNFETIKTGEQTLCANFLAAQTQCPALITSRQMVNGARAIYVDSMSPEEADEFLERLMSQMQDPQVFSAEVRQRIIRTADYRPYVMQWISAQIDQEAQEPRAVLEELEQGKGDAAERVFDRSFSLPQVGDDGQATLLALSLFVPSASRPALAEVAGFGHDIERLNQAIKSLRALLLARGTDENQRLVVEGLTRSLARARLSKDAHAAKFHQRFVAHFLSYAEAHAQPTPEDFDALEAEKDNLLSAMDRAFDLSDWASVMQLMDAISFDGVNGFLTVRGYWDESIRRGEQALKAALSLSTEHQIAHFTHNLAVMYQFRGELTEARRLYNESLEIKKRLGNQSGIASTLHELGRLAQVQGKIEEARRLYDESLEISRRLDNQRSIANTLHQLGKLAQDQGEIEEARRLYNESLEIEKRLDNQSGIAISLHQLGRIAQIQGKIEEARRLYDESLEISRRLGNQNVIASALLQLGLLTEKEGNKVEAVLLVRESLGIFEKLKSPDAEIARRNLEILEGNLPEAGR